MQTSVYSLIIQNQQTIVEGIADLTRFAIISYLKLALDNRIFGSWCRVYERVSIVHSLEHQVVLSHPSISIYYFNSCSIITRSSSISSNVLCKYMHINVKWCVLPCCCILIDAFVCASSSAQRSTLNANHTLLISLHSHIE